MEFIRIMSIEELGILLYAADLLKVVFIKSNLRIGSTIDIFHCSYSLQTQPELKKQRAEVV